MNLTVDKGPFNTDLRKTCIALAIFFLVALTIGVIIVPGTFTNGQTFFGFVIGILGNVALLYGSLKNISWFVLAWLIMEILFYIGWPIVLLGLIFNFGGYRHAAGGGNVFVLIFVHILSLIFNLFCTRLVYSFFDQLRNRQSQPQHAVVV